ncbi:hypothetical protein GN244_ATG01411 [Phytophthora infestans]|nr:hypothetical protein GN244_ATG01411 [Phytophthora infestans]
MHKAIDDMEIKTYPVGDETLRQLIVLREGAKQNAEAGDRRRREDKESAWLPRYPSGRSESSSSVLTPLLLKSYETSRFEEKPTMLSTATFDMLKD